MAITIVAPTEQAQANYKQLKSEVSRLASMANKRLKRLENKGLEEAPAYKKWVEAGAEKFSVRGKSYNELQKELARVRQFTNAKTSTIKGATKVLQEIANNIGVDTLKPKEMLQYSKQFFSLARKIEEYIRNTENTASAIGYHKIWQAINQYTQQEKVNLADTNADIDKLVEDISSMLSIVQNSQVLETSTDESGYIFI